MGEAHGDPSIMTGYDKDELATYCEVCGALTDPKRSFCPNPKCLQAVMESQHK